MTWIAAHQSPTGMLARYTHASRDAAAMALYTALSNISGAREARQRLVASVADFIAEIDGHWFSLSDGDAMPQDWAGAADPAERPHTAPSATGSVGAAYDVSSLKLPAGVPSTSGAFSSVDTIEATAIPVLLHEGTLS